MKKRILTICLLLCSFTTHANESETEVQMVISKLMVIAEELLLEHGEFFPFGGAMKKDGEVVTLSGIDGMNNEQPSPDEVIENVQLTLRIGAENAEYKVGAILRNVNVTPPGESERTTAVAVAIDHALGLSLLLVFPYQIDEGEVVFGDVFAKGGENKLFDKR